VSASEHEAALLAANGAFYDAVESLDLDVMARVWDDADDVFCVHPGGEMIAGWGPVRRSWAAIFASTSYLQCIVTDVRCRVGGDLGWVTCTENLLTAAGEHDHVGAARAIASNLFARRHGRWRMVAHHASPVLRAGHPGRP
jgi:ketosteroid isomerase-like protein